jgi:hypothetical protein
MLNNTVEFEFGLTMLKNIVEFELAMGLTMMNNTVECV